MISSEIYILLNTFSITQFAIGIYIFDNIVQIKLAH